MIKDETEDEKILFSRCCDEWLKQKENSIKISSYYNYKFAVEKHIKPALGDKTLEELEKYDFNDFIKYEKANISDLLDTKKYFFGNTEDFNLKSIVVKLRSILNYTTKKYGIIFDLDALLGIASNSTEIDIFNEKEFKKMTKYLLESNLLKEIGVLISLYSGLRIGEVCGLKWSDIDFENGLLSVNRTVQRLYMGKNEKSKIVITKPKTKKSRRKIPISKVLLKKLKEYENKYPQEAFVLTGRTDKFYEPLAYRYDYKMVLEKCNIPYRNYHQLRHFFASNCISVGMDAKSLSEVLGHSNIGITMNLYVHSNNEIKKKYIDRL